MELKDRLKEQWAALADTWIEFTSNGGDPHRQGLLDSWMLDAIGDVTRQDVVDLGCGEGRFSRMMAERGAKVTGLDLNERFIDFARANQFDDEEYVVGDMENLSGSPDQSFDMAVSYITLVDVPDFRRAVEDAYRVLRHEGLFVVCNLQPMITAGNGWIKHVNEKLHFKLDDYFDESVRVVRISGYEIHNFHRTLSNYVNSFVKAGFVVEGLKEPMPSPQQVEKYPDVADNLRVPLFIIYMLRNP